jgi:polysaccharide biosynthesis transport protein
MAGHSPRDRGSSNQTWLVHRKKINLVLGPSPRFKVALQILQIIANKRTNDMDAEIIRPSAPERPTRGQAPKSRAVMPSPPIRDEGPEASFSEMWRIVRRRKKIIWSICGAVFFLSVLVTILATRKYQSTVIIEFNTQNMDSLDLSAQHEPTDDSGSSEYSLIQLTEAKVLESDNLALQVVNELNLEARSEYSGRQSFADYFRRIPDESKLPLEQAPFRRMSVLKAWRKGLRVEPLAGTRMISIIVRNPNAEMAATIANRLVADYKQRHFEGRYEATIESSGWLSKQLGDLKTDLENSEQKLVDYQKQAGILGTDETHNIVMSRLEDVNKELTVSESNRILSQTIAQLVRNGNPELISGLTNPTISQASSISKDALTPLANLRDQKRLLDLQYAEAATKYGSAYPKLVELQNQRKEMDVALHDEIERLAETAQNDFVAARNTENALRATFENEKETANKLNDSAIHYTILKHEVESSRDLYDGLLKKLKEAGILAGFHSTNIVVIDPARPADRPAQPIVPLYLGAGLFGGLLLGVGSGFLAENLDDTINTSDDVERILMLPSLGMIPTWKRHASLPAPKTTRSLAIRETGVFVVSQSHSHPAEAFRAVRTAISQSIRSGVPTVILMTSPLPGEGKTTVTLNCAAAFAQQGSRVLLVEADLRRPKLCTQLNLRTTSGLTTLLGGDPCLELPIKLPGLPCLSVIPAGPLPNYPAELMGSERMKTLIDKWRLDYDFIFFDTPPVLAVTDAVVLAGVCDLIVLIAKSRSTQKLSLVRARSLFLNTKPRMLGVIVNGLDANSSDYSSYYGYESNSKEGAGYYKPVAK